MINKPVEQIHYCVEVFQIIKWKERTVYVLSKNLHQSVPYAQNKSCLAYKRLRMDRNKIRSGDKIQNGGDHKFVGWRHESRDSTPCNWNNWRYLLFCCYCRHGRRVNSLCQITGRLLFFRIRVGRTYYIWIIRVKDYWCIIYLLPSVWVCFFGVFFHMRTISLKWFNVRIYGISVHFQGE